MRDVKFTRAEWISLAALAVGMMLLSYLLGLGGAVDTF